MDLPFGLWSLVGRRKHKFSRIRKGMVAPMCPLAREHWRHLANTAEPSVFYYRGSTHGTGKMRKCGVRVWRRLKSGGKSAWWPKCWLLLLTLIFTLTLLHINIPNPILPASPHFQPHISIPHNTFYSSIPHPCRAAFYQMLVHTFIHTAKSLATMSEPMHFKKNLRAWPMLAGSTSCTHR